MHMVRSMAGGETCRQKAVAGKNIVVISNTGGRRQGRRIERKIKYVKGWGNRECEWCILGAKKSTYEKKAGEKINGKEEN